MLRTLVVLFILATCPGFTGTGRAATPHNDSNKEGCRNNTTDQCCQNRENRGWGGKRKGDWYGARQPVTTAQEAEQRLRQYYNSQDVTVSDVVEKRWCYQANLVKNNGLALDRVMIDKRSGRIRSIY